MNRGLERFEKTKLQLQGSSKRKAFSHPDMELWKCLFQYTDLNSFEIIS